MPSLFSAISNNLWMPEGISDGSPAKAEIRHVREAARLFRRPNYGQDVQETTIVTTQEVAQGGGPG